MADKGMLIVLSGPSGVGKGTVLKAFLKAHPQFRSSISATTRAPREGEEHGVNYYFYTQEQFYQMVSDGGMLEYAVYNGNCYGTPRHFVEEALQRGEDVILEIEVKGAAQVKATCPDACFIFIIPPDFSQLAERLRGRGTEDADTIMKRLAAAKDELLRAAQYDYIIVNDRVEAAADRLYNVIEAARYSSKHQKYLIDEVLKDA